MDWLTIIIGGILLLLFIIYRYLTKDRGYLETLPWPMMKPGLIFGSPPFDLHNHIGIELQLELKEKYGDTYTKYDGKYPSIVTIDPEIVKEVLIKQFENFSAIVDFNLPERHMSLDLSSGEQWKELRKEMSPTFTSGKLKSMMEPMERIADNFLNYIKKENIKNGFKEIEVKQLFQGYALDTISSCAFGIESNALENPNDELLVNGKQSFASFRFTNPFISFMMFLFNHFPFLLNFIPIFPPAYDRVIDITREIMKSRIDSGIITNDFISKLIDMRNNIENPNYKGTLTTEMIYPQGAIFFVAGFETTAATLTALFYYLSKYPKMQDRLYEEIQNLDEINSESLADLEYLQAFLNETLRIAPPAVEHFRICTKDTTINGIPIKKGTRVFLPIYASHMNPKFFSEPTEFNPERFMKGNAEEIIPLTYRPFGGGNRLCIGIRFAMTEMKIAIARILNEFKIIETEKTKFNCAKGEIFLFSVDEMFVKFIPREE